MKFDVWVLAVILEPAGSAVASEGFAERGSQLFAGLWFAGAIGLGLLVAYAATRHSAREKGDT